MACFISCSLRERKEERGQQSFIFISVPLMTAINHLYYEWSIPFSHFRHLFYLFSLSLALCLGFEGTALSLSAESAPVRLVEKEKSCNQCLWSHFTFEPKLLFMVWVGPICSKFGVERFVSLMHFPASYSQLYDCLNVSISVIPNPFSYDFQSSISSCDTPTCLE